MPGMKTQLNLMADATGTYSGSSANLSGPGFAGMHFAAQSLSQEDFDAWVQAMQESPQTLDNDAYSKLAMPTTDVPPSFYGSTTGNLFERIVSKSNSVQRSGMRQ